MRARLWVSQCSVSGFPLYFLDVANNVCSFSDIKTKAALVCNFQLYFSEEIFCIPGRVEEKKTLILRNKSSPIVMKSESRLCHAVFSCWDLDLRIYREGPPRNFSDVLDINWDSKWRTQASPRMISALSAQQKKKKNPLAWKLPLISWMVFAKEEWPSDLAAFSCV